jgi:hypothetical protein
LRDYAGLTLDFLAEPSFFTVMDTYGIELIHPRREGRSKRQIGKKGKSNGRWIIGIKLAWLINDQGEVVDWTWDTPMSLITCFGPWRRATTARRSRLLTWACAEKMRRRPTSTVRARNRGMSASPSKPIELGDGAVSCQKAVSSRQEPSGSALVVSGSADQLSAAADQHKRSLAEFVI